MGKRVMGNGTPLDLKIFRRVAKSEWSCRLFDKVGNVIVWTPDKGEEPNFFHRWMQRLCFGFKWTKEKADAGTGIINK